MRLHHGLTRRAVLAVGLVSIPLTAWLAYHTTVAIITLTTLLGTY